MRRSALRRSADAGFTLIELLIVIVILGILAAIVVFSVSGITNKGNAAACHTTVSEVDTAYEAYVADNHGSAAPGTTNITTLASYFHGTPPSSVTDKSGTSHSITTVSDADGVNCDG